MARTYRRKGATHLAHEKAPVRTPEDRARFHADRPLPRRDRYESFEFPLISDRRMTRDLLRGVLKDPGTDILLPVPANRHQGWDPGD
jgi:hypothetical protein